MHALAWVTGSTLVAGVLISLAAGRRSRPGRWRELAGPLLGERGAHDAVLYFALYPVGFVFTSLYSEALFLALAAGAFLAAMRGLAVHAGVLGGSRPGRGCSGWRSCRRSRSSSGAARDPRSLARLAPLLLLPGRGRPLRALPRPTHGDPWAFMSAQADWKRDASPLGPLGGLRDRRWPPTGARGDLLDLPATGRGTTSASGSGTSPTWRFSARRCWLTWVAWRRLGTAYGLYSAAHARDRALGTAEGFPLVSLPRFLLADFPLFLGARLADARRGHDARDAAGLAHVRRRSAQSPAVCDRARRSGSP